MSIRISVLIMFSFLAGAIVLSMPPMAQDMIYHQFADAHELLGVSNFCNVASNLPFILVGLLGYFGLTNGKFPRIEQDLKPIYYLFFASVTLIGLGSAFYHLAPENASLVWDRYPMTVAFMSFFCIIVGEYIDRSAARFLCVPLVIFGLASVAYWGWSESVGQGDLRLYVVAQFLPIVLIPFIISMFSSSNLSTPGIWLMLAIYMLSKLFEFYDTEIFELLGLISGHSLKHLASALAIYVFYRLLRTKKHE